jgi:hypothetical protein
LANLAEILKGVHRALCDVPMGVDGEWVRYVAGMLIDARRLVADMQEQQCDNEHE